MLRRPMRMPRVIGRRQMVSKAGQPGVTNRFALIFPSNISGSDQSAPFVAIKFSNPHSDGLPIWGPSGQGVTIIRRYKPTAQQGYYGPIPWYADDSSFEESKSGTRGYWGSGPYPPGGSSGTSQVWEVASDDGGDFTTTDGGGTKTVVNDAWYLQGTVITRAGASSKTIKYYTELPSVAAGDIVTANVTFSNYGEGNPPQAQPQLTIGDSPWYGTYQHERTSGSLGQIKIIAKALSQSDLLLEAADMNNLVTADAQSWIWWGKKGFATVEDLTCDYGTGRTWVWADTSNKGTLGAL